MRESEVTNADVFWMMAGWMLAALLLNLVKSRRHDSRRPAAWLLVIPVVGLGVIAAEYCGILRSALGLLISTVSMLALAGLVSLGIRFATRRNGGGDHLK